MGGNEFALAMQCGYKQGYEEGAIAELKKIKEIIKSNRDEWIKGQDYEWNAYNKCMCIINNELSELEGD